MGADQQRQYERVLLVEVGVEEHLQGSRPGGLGHRACGSFDLVDQPDEHRVLAHHRLHEQTPLDAFTGGGVQRRLLRHRVGDQLGAAPLHEVGRSHVDPAARRPVVGLANRGRDHPAHLEGQGSRELGVMLLHGCGSPGVCFVGCDDELVHDGPPTVRGCGRLATCPYFYTLVPCKNTTLMRQAPVWPSGRSPPCQRWCPERRPHPERGYSLPSRRRPNHSASPP